MDEPGPGASQPRIAPPRRKSDNAARRGSAFYGIADVDIVISTVAILGFLTICLLLVGWIFRTGYKLKA